MTQAVAEKTLDQKAISEINEISLRLFNAVIESTPGQPELITEYGVYLGEDAAYAKHQVMTFLRDKKLTGEQLNQTFHKSWEKIQTSSRLELALHQILHYLSTYGTNFEAGMTYIPAEEMDLQGKALPVYVIGALSRDAMTRKCEQLLASGIALAEDSMKAVLRLMDLLDYTFTSVDWIKNKEAKVVVMERKGVYPDDPSEFLRFVVYKATGATLLIKNDQLIDSIKDSGYDPSGLFADYGHERLAQVFNRYKPIFLAFKSAQVSDTAMSRAMKGKVSSGNRARKAINRIAKLSKTHHVAMVQNPLNEVTSKKLRKKDLHWLKNATPFALFKALNVCHVRMAGQRHFAYKIRNGKTWVAESTASDEKVLSHNLKIIQAHLKERFDDKLSGAKVYVPNNIQYGLPTSEKMFVGRFPMGTRVAGPSLVAGIYWEDAWGANDLDLSGLTLDGKVGWNSSYIKGGLMYSGDLTSAPNGAVEYLHANSDVDDTLIMVNCYSGDHHDHSYNIIVADADDPTRQHMMNPENLILNERFTSKSGESITGLFSSRDGELVFALYPLCGGNARISGDDENSMIAQKAFLAEVENGLTINDLLVMIGAELVDKAEDADIDLSINKVEKSTFVELFS